MLNNYLKFSIRNIKRNRLFSAINIFGLAISLTALILMALYIENEWSFDRFHEKAQRIYRVADDKQTPDILIRSAASAAPVAPALLTDYPEVQEAARINATEALVKYENKLFEERKIFYADPGLLNIFSFKMMKGNPANALKDPMSIIVTEQIAGKYFGTAEPLDKILSLDDKNMKVTGVIKNIPANSHLNFDFLVSMSTAQQKGSGNEWLFTNWYSNNFYTYLLLPENYDVNRLTARMEDFDKRHHENGSTTKHHYALEKLTDIYLHSDRENQAGKTGSITNLYVFSAAALIILLVACVNFINLSTARAAERAKEVAIKKVAGAAKGQMIIQFFTESFLMTLISLTIAIILASAFLPAFNNFSGKSLSLDLFSIIHTTSLLVLLIGIALLSGSYPAFILSGFKPASALKGKIRASLWSIGIRKGLVVFQFAVSIVLIVCSLVIYRQLQYMQQHDLGFKSSQTMVINFEGDNTVQQQYQTIRRQMLNIAGVKKVTASSNVPGDRNANTWSMDFAKKNGDTVSTELAIYLADFNYLDQYAIPIIAGRGFSEQYAADSTVSMLINETALKKLGFNNADEVIGIHVGMYPKDGKVIGVFKDFHFESLQKSVAPLVIRVIPSKFRLFSIEINSGNIRQTVAEIEKTWSKSVPQRPLEFSFLDESYNKQYQSEIQFGKVFAIFTSLAIIVACLGLFGLALFSIQQRTKEIGIRKVLGASVTGITSLLSKDFIRLVFIAILIASPISWYVMTKWLQDYSYHIEISWWLFVIAGSLAVVIALLTISFHAVKAAIANPVKSLRAE